jgi:hypothetical protein
MAANQRGRRICSTGSNPRSASLLRRTRKRRAVRSRCRSIAVSATWFDCPSAHSICHRRIVQSFSRTYALGRRHQQRFVPRQSESVRSSTVPGGYGDRFLSRVALYVAANGGAHPPGRVSRYGEGSVTAARQDSRACRCARSEEPCSVCWHLDRLRAFGSVASDAVGEEAAGEWRNGRA